MASSNTSPQRRALIDIGTNSVKLLVADIRGGAVSPVLEKADQTRLGRGFYETQRIQPEAIERTAHAVATFVREAHRLGAPSVRAIATSAARDARNADELLEAIRSQAGLRVEVISGEQEADWSFRGATSDGTLANRRVLLMDVGGGSTEFILGTGAMQQFRRSFSLGAVRLMEALRPGDPPSVQDWNACESWLGAFLKGEAGPALSKRSGEGAFSGVQLVGTGGTVAILARMELCLQEFDRDRIEGFRLSLEAIRRRRTSLWSQSISMRRGIAGLPPERADVILTGIAIFEAVMGFWGFADLWVTTRGLRFGALLDEAWPEVGVAEGH